MEPAMTTDDISSIFDSELIEFLSHRYGKSVSEIINQFLIQNGSEESKSSGNCRRQTDFNLENNEMEILKAYYNRRCPLLPHRVMPVEIDGGYIIE